MNIGIIGSGNVGGTLGRRWANLGHQVVFSSRNPGSDQMKELVAKSGTNARAASPAEAAASASVILLSTPWPATREAIASAGSLDGKIIIDTTNPLLPDLSGLEIGTTTSGAEQIAEWAPGAKVVKCFNTVGFGIMENPKLAGHDVTMLYCSDDADAKARASQLAGEIGFAPKDAGPLKQARYLEPFAMLWISCAVFYGFGRDFAFQFISR